MDEVEICGCSQSEALKAEAEVYRKALEVIAREHQSYDDPAVRSGVPAYSTGVVDGHRCAATLARAALNAVRS